MRYACTIYTHEYMFGGNRGFTGGDPVFDSPLAHVVVSGDNLREAAARAYVQCVGRLRARRMRQNPSAPRAVIAQETSCKAIAASLRKTARHRRMLRDGQLPRGMVHQGRARAVQPATLPSTTPPPHTSPPPPLFLPFTELRLHPHSIT